MHRLVSALITEMGDAYGELGRAQASIEATFEQEEERFRRTLGRGTALLEDATANLKDGDTLSGETAFTLYDTYGFPLDLTQDALRSRGIDVDTDGFDKAMAKQKEASKAAGFKSGDAASDDIWLAARDAHGETEFTGHDSLTGNAPIHTLVVNGEAVSEASNSDIMFACATTPFYAESGGQAGDKGVVTLDNGATIAIKDVVKKTGDLHVHIGTLSGTMSIGDIAHFAVDAHNRKQTMANHSATHIMHEALRRVLGPHVSQKGQMVDGERIRFDISHGAAITRDELRAVENEVNAVVQQNVEAGTKLMSPDAAIEAGAMALFGEKYGDEVRVLSLGDPLDKDSDKSYSVELCGGTHVERTGDIALFKIVSEGAVAAGIRRVEAVTGEFARRYLETQAGITRALADKLKTKPEDVPTRLEALLLERKQFESYQRRHYQRLKRKVLHVRPTSSLSLHRTSLN